MCISDSLRQSKHRRTSFFRVDPPGSPLPAQPRFCLSLAKATFQVKEALGVVLTLPADRRRPCGVFGSFGWSGEAVDELQFRLKDSGFPIAFDPIRAKFRPTEDDVGGWRFWGGGPVFASCWGGGNLFFLVVVEVSERTQCSLLGEPTMNSAGPSLLSTCPL